VCDVYVGYDRYLGICLCQSDYLEDICNLECRVAQRDRIGLVCAEPPLEVHIVIRHENDSISVSYRLILM
jgi:hypothetical protein